MKGFFLLQPLVKENMDGCIDAKSEINSSSVQTKSLVPAPNNKYINDDTFKSIHDYFFCKNVYLDPELTLGKIAAEAGINKNKLSGLIQEYYNTGFSELVNRLRINYFIMLANSKKNLTMETLIYESGFIHRSTFYAAFKKHIGINPSTYIKDLYSAKNQQAA